MVTVASTIRDERPGPDELVALYDAVGWAAYTRDPEALTASIAGSHSVLTARDAAGRLLGLVRTVSDGVTIVYVQDVLVVPSAHRLGIGGALLDTVLHRYSHVRQAVLLTDAEAGQRAFYESRGFVEVRDVEPQPLRSFVLLR
jgi:GNAT superfamily N-acetyltransferase